MTSLGKGSVIGVVVCGIGDDVLQPYLKITILTFNVAPYIALKIMI